MPNNTKHNPKCTYLYKKNKDNTSKNMRNPLKTLLKAGQRIQNANNIILDLKKKLAQLTVDSYLLLCSLLLLFPMLLYPKYTNLTHFYLL